MSQIIKGPVTFEGKIEAFYDWLHFLMNMINTNWPRTSVNSWFRGYFRNNRRQSSEKSILLNKAIG